MRIPQSATAEMQQTFREIGEVLDAFKARNVDLSGRRVVGAGDAIQPQDYITKAQLDRLLKKLESDSLEPRLVAAEKLLAAIVAWFETGIFNPPA